MPLVIGTDDGAYTAPGPDGDPERTLAAGVVRQVRRFAGEAWAATDEGVFHAPDGRNWVDAGVPEPAAAAVAASPDGRRVYAGTRPAHVYVSPDGGDTWTRSESFASLPGRDGWENLGGVGPQVRAFATHPAAPQRLVAGVEAAGVYVSPDAGDTWERRRDGLHADVHGLRALGRDEWVAACGGGLYRTTDAGESWQSLDTSPDLFWYTYARETVEHDGVLYASLQNRAAARYDDSAPGRILASTDRGREWTMERFPGDHDAFVVAWTVHEGTVLAGTSDGRVLARDDDWRTVCEVHDGVRSLATWES